MVLLRKKQGALQRNDQNPCIQVADVAYKIVLNEFAP
jgi:hypothetical protein